MPRKQLNEAEIGDLRSELESLRARVAELEALPQLAGEPPPSQLIAALLQLPILFYRVGSDGRFRDVIGRSIGRLGLDQAEMIGRNVLDIFPEAETEFLESLAGDTVSSASSGTFEGNPWAALSYVTPAADGDDTVGVSLDITEWHNTRKELAASEQRYRSLAETVPTAITRNDPEGFVIYANEPTATLLGVRPEDLVGRAFLDFVHEDDQAGVVEEWLGARARNAPYAGTFRIRREGCENVWLLSNTVPEYDAHGEIVSFVSSLVDISERKQIEDELGERVAERTEQLVLANKELESFCYSVSHDLRAPLRSIDGFSRMLAEELGAAMTPVANDYLRRVLGASARMDRLIDDFLILSRSSLAPLSRQPVNLSELANGIVQELSARPSQRTVRFDIARGVVGYGDPTLLQHAMENLLGNAFKFTSRTADALIEFFATTSPDGDPAFVVRDNGAGFSMAHATRLFTAFHRLHNDDEFEGTGVGLATVERIIRRHGGRIWAEAEPGEGATFTFTLPASP